MSVVPDAAKKVPMMFRAQVTGRCQLQRITRDEESHAQLWANQWIDKIDSDAPGFGSGVQSRTYPLTWRFVTNSGQDDGVIRPVIGARGYPFYPGSSMKGIFRRACTPEQGDRYCGKVLSGGDYEPGILRFLGGYPTDTRWTENLVDIVHPQQDWQVKDSHKSSGAFVQISLYKPELRFGLSSTEALSDSEWKIIWEIWGRALSTGIGCRVCAGYGQPENHLGEVLFKGRLKGQGQAAKLLDGTGEFRPNIFRAGIRGHALRLFGGLTDARTADSLVNDLFGSAMDKGTVGLLSMAFREISSDPGTFGHGNWAQPIYKIEGELLWFLTQSLPDAQTECLKKLIAALTRFAMLLGGFGKSWRRADHRLFFEEYYEADFKPLIGCHWQWSGTRSLALDVKVRKLEKVGEFITEVQQTAAEWMRLRRDITPTPDRPAPWREAWHCDRVQVWGRVAEAAEDCEAIRWLHGAYREAIPQAGVREGSIYRSSITGQVNQIGRLWHRMFPFIRMVKDPKDPNGKPVPKETRQYFELLTVFPDGSTESDHLIAFLENQPKPIFQKLWGTENN